MENIWLCNRRVEEVALPFTVLVGGRRGGRMTRGVGRGGYLSRGRQGRGVLCLGWNALCELAAEAAHETSLGDYLDES